jgi:hypothetical protein
MQQQLKEAQKQPGALTAHSGSIRRVLQQHLAHDARVVNINLWRGVHLA